MKNNTLYKCENFRNQSLIYESIGYMKTKCFKIRNISPKVSIVILNTVRGFAFKIYLFWV